MYVIYVQLGNTLSINNRRVYGIFDLLGDLGGFYASLYFFAASLSFLTTDQYPQMHFLSSYFQVASRPKPSSQNIRVAFKDPQNSNIDPRKNQK